MSRVLRTAVLLLAVAALASPHAALAATKAELNRDAIKVYNQLISRNKAAALLAKKARAVLVFPDIVKAGFMFGGQIGEGVLLKGGKPAAYYNTVAASYGLQAGVQVYGYALFF